VDNSIILGKSEMNKLFSVWFQILLMVHSNRKYFEDQTSEEVAEWAIGQLKECGFITIPLGSSWGVLTEVIRK